MYMIGYLGLVFCPTDATEYLRPGGSAFRVAPVWVAKQWQTTREFWAIFSWSTQLFHVPCVVRSQTHMLLARPQKDRFE